jgi:FMN phosphatase YigB (HAD superfamily)
MAQQLEILKGVIWDLDDTLYSVTPALHTSMREAAAKMVVDMGHPISYEEALQLATESQEKHRLTVKLLVDRFQSPDRLIHLPFHANMDHTVIKGCADLPTRFAQNKHLDHVLVTHASRDWALRMLDHLGLADFFKPDQIFGLECIDFEKKDSSERATKTGLEKMGLNPDEVAFAEDRDWNLTIPKALGLTTVLIDHPSQPRTLPEHVDLRFERAAEFLKTVQEIYAAGHKREIRSNGTD